MNYCDTLPFRTVTYSVLSTHNWKLAGQKLRLLSTDSVYAFMPQAQARL